MEDLNWNSLKKAKLESEVSWFCVRVLGWSSKRMFFCVFVETQMGEMRVEIERVKWEREVELRF